MTAGDPLRQALKEVRKVGPSPDLEARLLRALAEAEKRERVEKKDRCRRRMGWLGQLRVGLPALASVAIAAHLVVLDTGREHAFVEHRIDLPDVGHAALSLSLSLAEHDAAFASVRMALPHGIRVSPLSQALSKAAPDCHRAGCVYEFLHPTAVEGPQLEVHVDEPGMYRVEVEHASDSKRLREIIVVHAQR